MDSVFGQQAMMLLGNRQTQSDAEKERIKTALLPLYLNLSLTELRLDSPHKALKYGNKALEIDSTNTKGLFRCGQVRTELLLARFPKASDKNPFRCAILKVLFLYKKLPRRLKIGMMTAQAEHYDHFCYINTRIHNMT